MKEENQVNGETSMPEGQIDQMNDTELDESFEAPAQASDLAEEVELNSESDGVKQETVSDPDDGGSEQEAVPESGDGAEQEKAESVDDGVEQETEPEAEGDTADQEVVSESESDGVDSAEAGPTVSAAEPAEPDSAESADPITLRQKKRRRNRIIGAAALAVVLVVVVVLQVLGNDAANRQSSAAIEEQVVSGSVESGNIGKTLNAFGTLASADEEDVSVPGEIRVASYHVKVGDAVKKGDIIATVDRSTVLAAIADVQELIDKLDAEVEELKDSSVNSSITASASGTVVKVYAEVGKAVADVMYEHGALMLVSLDGLYALEVDNKGNLGVGDTVIVTGSDGVERSGRIAAIEKEKATVTVPLSGFSFDEKVTARTSSGAELGSGKLSVYSQQKITGYSGTVSSIEAGEGSSVSSGSTLLTLTDTDYTADSQVLLKRRAKLVDQSNRLTQISKSGYVYADEDGVITNLNKDVLQDASSGNVVQTTSAAPSAGSSPTAKTASVEETATTQEATTAEDMKTDDTKTNDTKTNDTATNDTTGNGTTGDGTTGNDTKADDTKADDTKTDDGKTDGDKTDGGKSSGGNGESDKSDKSQSSGSQSSDSEEKSDASNHSDETTTVTASIIWLDSNGSGLSKGIPDAVTVSISGGGSSMTADISAGSGWIESFSLPKYDSNGKAIKYSVSLVGSVAGFSESSSVSGGVTRIYLKKNDGGKSSGSSSSASSSSSSSASASSASAASSGASSASGAGKMPSGGMPSGGGAAGGMSASGMITEEGATIEDAQLEQENPYAYDETVLAALMPNDMVSVDVSIDELDIGRIVVGEDVQVTLDALPGQSFKGKISALNPFGQNSGGNTKYTVTASMGKSENMLLGMSASVGIGLEDRANVLVIPEAALVEQDGKTYVYTSYDEGKDELGGLVEVETGIADGTNVEITSGLEAGQSYYYRYAGTVSYVFVG